MPDTPSDAFLQGQGIPVELSHIDTELTRLWGPAAQQVGGPDLENPTVTRVVLANLVVGSKLAEASKIDGVLDTVVERYPCRAIVLRQTGEGDRQVQADVSALCHLPAPGMPQVCSERIVLRAGPQALDLLPGAVRSLLEADLPFVLWWTFDPRESEALFLDLADECSRLILDLPDPGTATDALRLGLDLEKVPYARDIAWFGISRWRELVAQFFDSAQCTDKLKQIASVAIKAEAPDAAQPPRAGAWLAAWLAGQLGWKAKARQASTGRVEATFEGPGGPVAVTIETEVNRAIPFARINGVTLTTRGGPNDESTFELERPHGDAPEVRIDVSSSNTCALPRQVHAPTFDAPRRMAAALESAREDPPFRRALPHTLWLLG
ncbi:MAG TPA: glucose-6-phosphate dehydrogenase assembly protein OpcA [Isosphaeraceae bacterium]|jgi:glucose-6-phosphate dehydrogenase assembly protein OpcA|nr:glucose-6-phosphate dehydrogenase assembly protein OpcA [Isosphaeraceae bacterium]